MTSSGDDSEERMQKHEASEVVFSPSRLNDITHNYKNTEDSADENADESADMNAHEYGNNVSLYAHMQSNVPEPFKAEGRSPTSLNMPGGGSTASHKFLSGRRHSARDD